MKLSILIPTYNRSRFLLKNLRLLSDSIQQGKYQKQIEIIVSNNRSTDNTDEIVNYFIHENNELILRYFYQEENIGLEKNALFVLSEATADFVMYLGDDDFIDYNYLKEVFIRISETAETALIIPSNIPIDEEGKTLNGGRDIDLPTREFEMGFRNCLLNSWRGHQLSGLVFKRVGLIDSYIQNKVNNIYLFIYFVGFSSLRGKTFHITQYPVKITKVKQSKKDWGYGRDGLVNEIFDNYKKLFPNSFLKRFLLEMNLLRIQNFRYFNYLPNSWCNSSKSYYPFFSCIINIQKSKNTSLLTAVFFPFLVISLLIKQKLLIYAKIWFNKIRNKLN